MLFHERKACQVLKANKERPHTYVDSIIDRDTFCRLMTQFCEGSLTLDNAESIYKHLKERWMCKSADFHICFTQRASVFNVLLHFGSVVLSERNQQPICHYEHLLRWHDLTTLLGEDVLTTSFLAAKDLQGRNHRRTFCWPVVIGHDNLALNELLCRPLSDLHFHLKGSSFNFELNWMSLMNKTVGWSKQFNRFHYMQQQSLDIVDDEYNENFYLSMMKAAALRMILFEYVDAECVFSSLPPTDIALAEKVLAATSVDMAMPYAKNIDAVLQRLRHIYGKRYKGTDGSLRIPDYATTERITLGIDKSDSRYAFTVLSGERWMMYEIFRNIYAKNNVDYRVVAWFYAYLLYKAQFRTELVQNNGLVGFANFALYEGRKSLFIREGSVYDSLLSQLAVAGFLQGTKGRWLEARITPKNSKKQLEMALCKTCRDIVDSHFMADDKKKAIETQYAFILHFIKKHDIGKASKASKGFCRHYSLRYDIKKQALAIWHLREMGGSFSSKVVGIDAANSELYTRPEVFAQAFRFLRESMMAFTCRKVHDLGMTYHVGEDFHDVVDGLRAIDEVIHFLGFRNGDRIGHGMVLGIDVRAYYKENHGNVVMPKQVLLDNVAWLYYKGRNLPTFTAACKELEMLFETYFMQLYGNLSYHVTIWKYYLSWLLRGDSPPYYFSKNRNGKHHVNSKWSMFHLNDDKDACMAREDNIACNLYAAYHYDSEVRKSGSETTNVHFSNAVIEYICDVQKKILQEIERANICVECNPTSNLRIGHFRSYSTHPIMRMFNDQMPIDEDKHCISVSINTDDKGIFATSIEREYSLLALSLEKEYVASGKCSPRQIYDWLDKIRKISLEQRFAWNIEE